MTLEIVLVLTTLITFFIVGCLIKYSKEPEQKMSDQWMAEHKKDEESWRNFCF